MWRLARAMLVMVVVVAAASGLAMAAGRVGLTSDDGLRIVFYAERRPDNSRGIYWVNPVNGAIRPIIVGQYIDHPICSRVDNRIVFYDRLSETEPFISVINANGRNRHDMAVPTGVVSQFKWSPDGQQISYTEWLQGASDIKLLRLSGSFPVTTIDTATIETNAAWSPDGRRLAFDTIDQNGRSIVLYDLQTGAATATSIYDDWTFHSPLWLPDNSGVLYSSSVDDAYSIHAIDIASQTESKFADGLSGHWSPDGSQFAFVQYVRGVPTISILDIDSGEVETIPEAKGNTPIWSPDGQFIAFVSGRGSNHNISVMNADGSHLHELTHSAAHETSPCWLYLQNFPEGH